MYRARFAFVLSASLISLAGDARGDESIDAGAPARLQHPARYRVGLFTGGAFYSEDSALGSHGVAGSGFMFGGRAGALLGDWTADGGTFGDTVGVEVEAGMAYPSAGAADSFAVERTARVLGWGVHAVIGHLSDRPVHPFTVIGIGGETLLDGRGGEEDTDLALRAGLGLLLRAGPGEIRIDARVSALSGRDDDLTAAGAVHLGYSVRFGARAPRVGRVQLAHGGGVLPAPVFLVVAATTTPPSPSPPAEPGPPAAFAAAEDRDGDADDDGVLDANDTCPRTAETPNGVDDGDGCPDEVPFDLGQQVGTIVGVEFAPRSNRLTRRSRQLLRQLAAVLVRYPDVPLHVIGHTAPTGDAAADLTMSEQRAALVKWALVDRGVAEERFTVSGRGSEVGVARVELALVVPRARAATHTAPPLAWSERARLPDDAPPPVWIVSAGR